MSRNPYTGEHSAPGPLFAARARATDPPTSRAAAGRVPGGELASVVLAWLRANGPATAHEIAERTGLSLVTVSPRLKPLEAVRLVKRIGVRERRTIWQAV